MKVFTKKRIAEIARKTKSLPSSGSWNIYVFADGTDRVETSSFLCNSVACFSEPTTIRDVIAEILGEDDDAFASRMMKAFDNTFSTGA